MSRLEVLEQQVDDLGKDWSDYKSELLALRQVVNLIWISYSIIEARLERDDDETSSSALRLMDAEVEQWHKLRPQIKATKDKTLRQGLLNLRTRIHDRLEAMWIAEEARVDELDEEMDDEAWLQSLEDEPENGQNKQSTYDVQMQEERQEIPRSSMHRQMDGPCDDENEFDPLERQVYEHDNDL